jgi:hypothetical protein
MAKNFFIEKKLGAKIKRTKIGHGAIIINFLPFRFLT